MPNTPAEKRIIVGCGVVIAITLAAINRSTPSPLFSEDFLAPPETKSTSMLEPGKEINAPTQRELRKSPAGQYVLSIHPSASDFQIIDEWNIMIYQRNGRPCFIKLATGGYEPAQTGTALGCAIPDMAR